MVERVLAKDETRVRFSLAALFETFSVLAALKVFRFQKFRRF